MQVREIMTPDPVACTPEDRVVTAAKIMRERDCGAVPVVDSQDSRRVWGILTDRDIVLRVVARERDCLSTTVGESMTPDVFTVRPTDDVADVVQLMERQQIRRVPVVERATSWWASWRPPTWRAGCMTTRWSPSCLRTFPRPSRWPSEPVASRRHL